MFLRRNNGVTLIELIVVMSIIMFVIAGASRILTSLLTQFKQQTKIAETSIESIAALHILRRDLHAVGYGLSHEFEDPSIEYSEAVDSPASKFNDGLGSGTPGKNPRAIIANFPNAAGDPPGSGFGTAKGPTWNDSDYLVVKSLTVSGNVAGGKYHFLDVNNEHNIWNPNRDNNLSPNDYVITLKAELDGKVELDFSPSGAWKTMVGNDWNATTTDVNVAGFTPSSKFNTNLVYGVTSGIDLRFPFNRADYYITDGTVPYVQDIQVPERCAPGTGVLVKSVLQHSDGKLPNMPLPIMDCVADMQVVYRTSDLSTGIVNATSSPEFLDDSTAEDIRKTLSEVRVYILAHEGQYDPTFEYPAADNPVSVGDPEGRSFDLDSWIPEAITPGTDDDEWKHYRWRVYTVIVKPEVLRDSI